ncbi:MAG TPA: formate/nitrite transporter family protein [Gaiellales bacterium]|jgi:formate/nitrite transporter FocA (FNT family)
MAATAERLSAGEIYERVQSNAEEELGRSWPALAFSGLGAGLAMGFTALGVAAGLSILGEGRWQEFAATMLYPIGFIAVIVGRAQLFTENTLFPVVLTLQRGDRATLLDTARLWGVVFAANILGALVFAVLAISGGGLEQPIGDRMVTLGAGAVHHPFATVVVSGVFGGWLVALVAWLVTASHHTIGQVAIIWLLTFLLGLAHFAHCIASSDEALCAVVNGTIGVSAYGVWLAAATIGNIIGGVVIVAVLNYGQVRPDTERG